MENSNTNTSNLDYSDYYLHAFAEFTKSERNGGLKLVVGPTGLGKTSSIPKVISQLRYQGLDKGFIYTSHRHLLIKEMQNRLSEHNIPCVYLKKDEDLVREFLRNPEKGKFLTQLEEMNFFNYAETTRRSIEQIIQNLQIADEVLRKLNSIKGGGVYTQPKEEFSKRCSELLMIFKTGLSNRDLPDKNRQLLAHHPQIWKLFPYIAFKNDPQKPVLLVTIHKLLYGFFDGQKVDRVLALENNIIFIDEFDMQEKEMLNFLCSSPEIQNSFEFVRLFYEEMTRQKKQGYLASNPDDSDNLKKTKDLALKILDRLERSCTEEKFNFPQIRHFILKDTAFPKKSLSIFQSGVRILTTPFYLLDKETHWEIIKKRNANSLRARSLIDIISRTTDSILDFFSELYADELYPQWNSWVEQCYDQKNDNFPGRYKKIISEYGSYRRPARLSKERRGKEITNSIYFQGFNFFRLVGGVYGTSPEEVRIDQKKLTISPEYILWKICESNLVFALSATGDIKRYIHSFDLDWLEKNCNYLPIGEYEKEIIAGLKQLKESSRNYDINLSLANGLPKSHELNIGLSNLEKDQFFQKIDSDQTNENTTEHRKKTLSYFLETIRWISGNSQNQAHLVFVNSFTYIEKLFRPGNNQVPSSFYNDLVHTLEVVKQEEGREYFIRLEGKLFQLVFFDASKGREMEDKDFLQSEENVPLIVITTFPTASNGVNLKWVSKSNGLKSDFAGIHLLEAPHFYFSGKDSEDEDVDKDKLFIWQIWKLFSNHQISESNFMTTIQELNIAMMNQQYKNLPDYILNQISVFYQALGRVDRQWSLMPKMDVRLASGSSGVIELFEKYLTAQGPIAKNRLERETYTSSLILEINQQIEKQYLRKRVLNELRYEEIGALESRCKEKIEQLLQILVDLRNGEFGQEDSQKIMFVWWQIREAMLKHDYLFKSHFDVENRVKGQRILFEIDFMRDFAFNTAFLQNDHELFIDPMSQRVVQYQTETTKTYDLNRYYRNYSQNDIVDWYFQTHNYKLRYQLSSSNPVFTPTALQTILAGAVGEIALKSVLDHHDISLVPDNEYLPCLFEISDMQVQGVPIYIDAKNYSNWTTLYRFSAKPGDPEYDEKLNSMAFIKAAYKKWQYVVAQTGNKGAKLVFINLLAGDIHPNEGWDEEMNPVQPFTFSESIITVIQGIFNQEAPNLFRDDFISWVNFVKAQIQK